MFFCMRIMISSRARRTLNSWCGVNCSDSHGEIHAASSDFRSAPTTPGISEWLFSSPDTRSSQGRASCWPGPAFKVSFLISRARFCHSSGYGDLRRAMRPPLRRIPSFMLWAELECVNCPTALNQLTLLCYAVLWIVEVEI